MKVGDHQEDGSAKCQALPRRATLVMIMQARVGVVPPPASPTQEVEAEGAEQTNKKRKTHLKNQSIN